MKALTTLTLLFGMFTAYSQQNSDTTDTTVVQTLLPADERSMLDINPPLYLRDGKEINKDDVAKIKPADVESISVMKGPSAIEAFGEKGSHGVVVIRMKKTKFEPQKKLE